MNARCNDLITDSRSIGDDLRAPQRFAAAYPHHLAADHRLPDGLQLRTRPISPQDRRRHWRFLCSLSLQTRYQRLMSPRGLLPGELRRMVEIDYQREMALVATADLDGEERILGVARYVRDAGGDDDAGETPGAEFAIVVTDAWQRRGIGTLLLHRLREIARDAGIRQIAGLTLATNARMIALARRLGFEVSREHDDWTVKRVTWRVQDQVQDRVHAAADAGVAALAGQERRDAPPLVTRTQ